MEKIFVDFFASDRQFFCCLWIVVALRCSLLNAILLMVMTSQTLDGGEAARRQKCVIKCEIKIAGIFLVAKFNIFAAVYTKQKKVSVARALVVLQIRASACVCVWVCGPNQDHTPGSGGTDLAIVCIFSSFFRSAKIKKGILEINNK